MRVTEVVAQVERNRPRSANFGLASEARRETGSPAWNRARSSGERRRGAPTGSDPGRESASGLRRGQVNPGL